MGTFPSAVAQLGPRPPEQQPDLLTQMSKLAAFKNALGQQQIQQQTIQENSMGIQQKQREMQDQEAIMQAAAAHGGSLVDALPELASKISARSFVPLQKSIMDAQKAYSDKKKVDLENEVTTGNQLLGLIQQAKALPPDQYQQAFPQIAAQALKIKPELQGHIDPAKPVPQSSLDQFALGVATHTQLASMETEKRAQETQVREQATQQETLRHNKAMENEPTEARLALRSAQGDPAAEQALKRLDQSKREARPVNNIMTSNDAKDIADAIENGDQPPTLQGLYRNAGPVRAELARRGVPLAQMETDWKAVQKHIQTLNGPQQERLRQSISSAGDMLDKIDGLYAEWQKVAPTAGFKIFNRVSLNAMKNLPGTPGAVANALDAQIADLTADLGNVYMGGNSPTDHSLGLAGSNLKGDWNQETFQEATKQIRANLKIRQNSILNSQPVGVSGNTSYMPQQAQGGGQPSQSGPPAGATHTAMGSDGKKHYTNDKGQDLGVAQ